MSIYLIVLVIVIVLLLLFVLMPKLKCSKDCEKFRKDMEDFLTKDSMGIKYTSKPEKGDGKFVSKDKLLKQYSQFYNNMVKDGSCTDVKQCNKFIPYFCNDAGFDDFCANSKTPCDAQTKANRAVYGVKCANIWA